MPRVFLILFLLPIALIGTEPAKPNIVFILVDDMGLMDMSVPLIFDGTGEEQAQPLNAWYRTPNLERLARQGIRFTQFYAHTVCSPTRASIMTGQNSARHRTTQFISPWRKNTGEKGPPDWNWSGLTAADVTLPGLLRDAGYRTIHIGKGHFGPPEHEGADPTNLGFDVNIGGTAQGQPGSYWGEDGYGKLDPKRTERFVPHLEKYHETDTFLTEALTLEAVAEIDRAVAAEKPFYLYLSHYAVHTPFQSDPRFATDYADPDSDEASQAYATLVAGVDKSLGDLLDHLQEQGVAENTLIVFMGDNGGDAPLGGANDIASSAPFRGKKGSLWEGGSRVPFIAAWGDAQPGLPVQQTLPIATGGVQSQLGACYDIFPTFLHLAGAEAPSDHVVDGRDLKPLLAGSDAPDRAANFLSHFPHEHRSSYFTTFREGDWKLIYRYFPDEAAGEQRYTLYHIGDDISESVDLSHARPKKLHAMTQAMINALEEKEALYPMVEGVEQRPLLPGW